MRRAFLFLAAGLLASMALAGPTHAGLITVSGTYDISPAKVLELEFAFSSAVSSPTGTSSSPVGTFSASGNDVLFDLPAPGASSGSLSFTVMTTGFYEGTPGHKLHGHTGGISSQFHPHDSARTDLDGPVGHRHGGLFHLPPVVQAARNRLIKANRLTLTSNLRDWGSGQPTNQPSPGNRRLESTIRQSVNRSAEIDELNCFPLPLSLDGGKRLSISCLRGCFSRLGADRSALSPKGPVLSVGRLASVSESSPFLKVRRKLPVWPPSSANPPLSSYLAGITPPFPAESHNGRDQIGNEPCR